MSRELQEKYRILLLAEESFARGVALSLWVKRPQTTWHVLLPGMFLIDFLRRSQAIRQYSAAFLFPRKAALNTALAMIQGEDRTQTTLQTGEEIRKWLIDLKLNFEKLHQAHMAQITILVEHYSKLFLADGKDYPSLLRLAYGTRNKYENFLERLTAAEKNVDQAIISLPGFGHNIRERLQAEQDQVRDLRQRELERIFLKDEGKKWATEL